MMSSRFSWARLVLAGCAFALCVGFATDSAWAQESKARVADKEMASKHGVAESLGNMKVEEDKLPGTFEVSLGIGSCIAMIAVMKYL